MPALYLEFSGDQTLLPADAGQLYNAIGARDKERGVIPGLHFGAALPGPDGTFAPDAVDRAEISAAACPIEELLEIVGEWPRTAADLAGQVRVPVHYVLAEHEALWNADQGRVDAFAGIFTSAPSVDAALARGVGRNIDHHHLGRALQLQQLAFALTCTPVPVPA